MVDSCGELGLTLIAYPEVNLAAEAVGLGDQVRTAVQFALPNHQAKGIELTLAWDGPIPLIRVDPARTQQVLGNRPSGCSGL